MPGFENSDKFQDACNTIIRHPDCNTQDKTRTESVATFSQQTNYVSSDQATMVGSIYKRLVNGGVYVKHDWWD